MALLNSTPEEQKETADNELREKISLEKELIDDLNIIFTEMADEVLFSYDETQQAPDLHVFNERIKNIINEHNEKVALIFGSKITQFLIDSDSPDSQLDQIINQMAKENGTSRSDIINRIEIQNLLATDQFVRNITNANSGFINNTNSSSINDAIESAEQDGLSREEPLDKNQIGEIASALFLSEALIRSKTIAATTTQQIAEGVKLIEVQLVQNITTAVPTETPLDAADLEPLWITVGDNVVRPAHAQANGQKRGEEGFPGAFLVGGEVLRFPGDPNGSIGNIANCRCSLVFVAL